jgi:hypothetical protein
MTGCKPNFESGGALADGGAAKLNSFNWVVWDESCERLEWGGAKRAASLPGLCGNRKRAD